MVKWSLSRCGAHVFKVALHAARRVVRSRGGFGMECLCGLVQQDEGASLFREVLARLAPLGDRGRSQTRSFHKRSFSEYRRSISRILSVKCLRKVARRSSLSFEHWCITSVGTPREDTDLPDSSLHHADTSQQMSLGVLHQQARRA